MSLSISQALIRCADLTRSFPDMRSKRIAIHVDRVAGLVRVAATDDHVAVEYRCELDDAFSWDPGFYTVRGADFPSWGSGHWRITATSEAIVCTSLTSKGQQTAQTRKRDRQVETTAERGTAFDIMRVTLKSSKDDAGRATITEFYEIRDALDVLHADADICLARGSNSLLSVVAGPLVASTKLEGPLVTMKFRVGVLDRAIGLLEGLDAGGLLWSFPSDRLAPVIMRSQCNGAVVVAMPLR